MPAYQRILLKLSGEALQGRSDSVLDPDFLNRFTEELAGLLADGIQCAVVVGGGNYCRGARLTECGVDRVVGDHIGMIATTMNVLALADVLRAHQVQTAIFSAIAFLIFINCCLK